MLCVNGEAEGDPFIAYDHLFHASTASMQVILSLHKTILYLPYEGDLFIAYGHSISPVNGEYEGDPFIS